MSTIVIVTAVPPEDVRVDGVKYVPEGAPPVDPPVPPDPTLPLPNPGAIVPPINWPMGQASSDLYQVPPNPLTPNGLIICYELPPLHGGQGVTFNQGQNTTTQGGCITEFSVSQIPGVIIPGQGAYYQKSSQLNNYQITVWRVGSTMPLAPDGQLWYLNIRWTNPQGAPNSFSRQWSASAA